MRAIFIFTLTIMSVGAYAQCSGVICHDIKIESMQVSTGGTIFVQTSGTEASLNCTPEAGVFLRLDGTTDGGKNVYSSLLSSQARAQNLDIRIIDNVSPCQITYTTVK